jgi:hypothetical protein
MFPALRTLTVIALLPLILGSCYSYRQLRQQYPATVRCNDQGAASPTVYAINSKELPYEYGILKKSGLFTFTSDSLCDQKIHLFPIEEYPLGSLAKTEALPAMVLTLGQLPMRFEQKYAFYYYLMSDSITVKKEYKLSIDKRVWFWDMFTFNRSRRNALAKSLYDIAKN